MGADRRYPMPSPCGSIVTQRIIQAALDLIDMQKSELCAVVESEQATPCEKYEALLRLAHITGVLTNAAAERAGMPC